MKPLKTVVKEYMLMRGQESLHFFPKYLQWGINGLKELFYDVNGVPSVATKALDDGQSRVTLPEDLVKLLRVGMMNSDGRLIEIHPDRNIVVGTKGAYSETSDTNVPQTVEPSTPISIVGYDVAHHSNRGEVYGRYYGRVGGSIYSYRHDMGANLLEFSTNVSGDIIIEYLASPEKVNGEHLVHEFIVEALYAYIDWCDIRFKRNVPANEKIRAERQYVQQKHNSRMRFMTLSIGNIINQSRKTFNSGPKY